MYWQSVSKRSVKIGSGKCRFEAGVSVTNVESSDYFIQASKAKLRGRLVNVKSMLKRDGRLGDGSKRDGGQGLEFGWNFKFVIDDSNNQW